MRVYRGIFWYLRTGNPAPNPITIEQTDLWGDTANTHTGTLTARVFSDVATAYTLGGLNPVIDTAAAGGFMGFACDLGSCLLYTSPSPRD